MRFTPLLLVLIGSIAVTLSLPAQSDKKLCRVHKIPMTIEEVPIRYGKPYISEYDAELMEAQQKRFPNAVDFVFGGCIVTPKKETHVAECKICRRLKTRWIATHPQPLP